MTNMQATTMRMGNGNPAMPDEHLFMRLRAMQLLDEGLEKEARRLFTAINRVQVRRIQAEIQAQEREEACEGMEG